MPRKTNIEINGYKYYRVKANAGRNPDGTVAQKDIYGKDKSDAEAKKEAFEAGIKSGLNKDYQNAMLGPKMHEWLFQVVRTEMSYNSFDRYESVYRNYIKNTGLNGMKINEVDKLTLKRHYNRLIDAGKSAGVVFSLNKLLKKFFFYCVDEHYLSANPCSRLKLPEDKSLVKAGEDIDDGADELSDVDPFTDDEIERIKNALHGTTKTIFLLGLATGLRRGELLGLTHGRIDLNERKIKVRKALKKVKIINSDETYSYEFLIDDLKTKNSKRDVPIPSSMLPYIHEHIEKQNGLFRKHNKNITDRSLFFTTKGAIFIDGKNLVLSWKRGLKRAGVRYRKFHNVRHTYATKLFEKGVQLKTVSTLLGHASIIITANTYVHVMPNEKDNAVETIDYLFV